MNRIRSNRSTEEWRRRCCSTHSRWTERFTVLYSSEGTCCVPYLQFDLLLTNFDSPKLKVHADGGKQLLVELAVHKSTQEGRFAWVYGKVPTEESPTSTSLYSAAITGSINLIIGR